MILIYGKWLVLFSPVMENGEYVHWLFSTPPQFIHLIQLANKVIHFYCIKKVNMKFHVETCTVEFVVFFMVWMKP